MAQGTEVMRWQGGGRFPTPYSDDFCYWWRQHVISLIDYPYVGINFRGDPDMPLPPGTTYGDSGASKHMTGYKEILSDFETKYFVEDVELGDDKCYKTEGVVSISFRLESKDRLHIDEVLYVPGLKKNLLLVSTLEDKGYWVIVKDKKALLWAKGSHLSTTEPIGTCSGGLYIMSRQLVQALAHDVTSSSDFWHRRLGHLH
jgi:hypothetical protein